MTSILRILATIVVALLVSLPAMADGVLVFGGTGRLGSEVVKELLKVDDLMNKWFEVGLAAKTTTFVQKYRKPN